VQSICPFTRQIFVADFVISPPIELARFLKGKKGDRCPRPPGLDQVVRTAIARVGHDKPMKLIMAVIKPFKLDDVREALMPLGVQGLTAIEVKGFGRQKGQTEIYRGAEYQVSFLPKVQIEVAVPDALVEQVLEAITQAARTGKIGDGKIFVVDLERALRIRTGETDDEAL